MTDEVIQQVINCYNKSNAKIYIASHPISDHVDYGVVWTDCNFKRLGEVSPYRFYLIRDHKNKCIGAVLDMSQDLHWYIIPGARKQGYLTRALTDAILPHLARKRKEQRVTINRHDIGDENFIASFNTAKKAGFKLFGELSDKIECFQKLRKYKKVSLKESYRGTTYEKMVKQREKMNVVLGNLGQIKAEVAMKLGESVYTRELTRIMEKLERYRTLKLDDAVYDFDQRQKTRRPGIR